MSRRKKQDRFTKTWSPDQARQQSDDRYYKSGGMVSAQSAALASQMAVTQAQLQAAFQVPMRVSVNWRGSASEMPGRQPFTGSEFALGTAVGVRSWDVDRLGRLVSPTYRMTWPPDEVVAQCRRQEGLSVLYGPSPAAEDHRQADCSCGFYAYYEGFNEYSTTERITGVIEGYGETQIGTRGFKSAKARIVALHIPPANERDERRIGMSLFERARRNYSGSVAIFDDYSQMVAEFPTTAPEAERTPDNDPDFWTRSAS